MKGCRTQQAGSLNTIGTSTTQSFIVGAIEKGPKRTITRLHFCYDKCTIPYRHQQINNKKD